MVAEHGVIERVPAKNTNYPTALFLGNGINCVEKNVEWKTLIDNLILYADVKKEIDISGKPFPLLYEEIVLTSAAQGARTENDIKRFIAHEMMDMAPNAVHQKIVEKSFPEIITTNYDHTLEKTVGLEKIKWDCNEQPERKYNIFRFNQTESGRIWHIHGDADAFQSITLGYEQYSGQLQRMRGYIATGTGDTYKKTYPPLIRALHKSQPLPGQSWLNLFFTHQVHVLGLSLDFVEIDLWWLLSYRSRAFHLEKIAPRITPVYYYYPKALEKALTTRLSLMKSFGVQLCSRPAINRNFYLEILDSLHIVR